MAILESSFRRSRAPHDPPAAKDSGNLLSKIRQLADCFSLMPNILLVRINLKIKKMKLSRILFLVFISVFAFTACEADDDEEVTPATTAPSTSTGTGTGDGSQPSCSKRHTH